MNTYVHTPTALSEVFTVVESKIQFIEYQAHCSMQDCMCPSEEDPKQHSPAKNNLMHNFEQMLQRIQQQTRELKLLQIIKFWLREENLAKVMELLHNNTYRQHSEESLEKMLKKGALELMQLRYGRN